MGSLHLNQYFHGLLCAHQLNPLLQSLQRQVMGDQNGGLDAAAFQQLDRLGEGVQPHNVPCTVKS